MLDQAVCQSKGNHSRGDKSEAIGDGEIHLEREKLS